MSLTAPQPTPRLFAAIAAALCFVLSAFAADATLKSFDVPAGDAAVTLKQFAQQAGQQLVFSVRDVKGVKTAALKADLPMRAALDRMLADTGLVAGFDEKSSTFAVRKETEAESKNANRAIAQNSDRPGSQKSDTAKSDDGVLRLDTFEVFGRKTLNMDIRRSPDEPQPYVVFGRSDLERSGANTIEDFLKTRLTMNTQGLSKEVNLSASVGGSQINLRGLGADQTLILIDGRRAASSSDRGATVQVDLNAIPVAAIERIEVLATTASGIYGGGATGGVINVVLRRDYAGAELRLNYENTFSTDAAIRRVDLSAGLTFEKGKSNLLIAGSWTDQNSLRLGDRDFYREARATILRNNPSFIYGAASPILGYTGNVRSSDGTNLVLKSGTALNSPNTFVPVGYAGATSDQGAALVANAGRYNFDLANTAQTQGSKRALSTTPQTESISLTFRRQVTPRLQMFVDSFGSNSTELFPAAALSGVYSVAATSPTNPFTKAITVALPILVNPADEETYRSIKNRRLGGGLIVKLPFDWQMEGDFTWSRVQSLFRFTAFTPNPPTAALAGVISSGGIDVLRDLNTYPANFSPYTTNLPYFYNIDPFQTTLTDATIRAGGPVGSLPGGPASVSIMVERRDERLAQTAAVFNSGAVTYPTRNQVVESGYVEVGLPLVGKDNRRHGVQSLQLQVAGRYDRYETHGVTGAISSPTQTLVRYQSRVDSTNPTIAFRYEPLGGITLRGSYGTGLLPPRVDQIGRNPPSAPVSSGIDPQRGNTVAGPYILIGGGNPDLRPEKSKSWSLGLIVAPTQIPGLRVSLDWTCIKKTDNIVFPTVQQVIDNEAMFPDRVVRGPRLAGDPAGWAGPITELNTSLINLARAEVEAIDAAIDYARDFPRLGRIEFFGRATWQTHYRTQLFRSSPLLENVGYTSNNPLKLKANAGLTWTAGAWRAGWISRYFDSYLVADPRTATSAPIFLNQGGERVPSQVFHDAFVAYTFARNAPLSSNIRHWLRSTELQVGVKNVFNRPAAFDASTATYYYSPFGDVRLASYYLSLRRSF